MARDSALAVAGPPVMPILAAAVVLMATSSPLTLAAQAAGMGVLAIAFWRMAVGSAMQTPLIAFERRGPDAAARRPDGRAFALTILGGAFLGAHFAGFIGALAHTSVASAMTLTTLTPLITAVASRLVLGERVPATFWPALAMAMAGAWIMTAGQWGGEGSSRLGNLLALLAAASATGYYMCGRRARASFPLGLYVTLVYAVAAATLLAAMLVSGNFALPPGAKGWLWVFLLALLPTTLGHSIANWSLRYVQPAFVSMTILGEAPIGVAMCWLWLDKQVSAAEIVGGLVTLAGLGVFLFDRWRRQRRLAATSLAGTSLAAPEPPPPMLDEEPVSGES